MRDAEFEAAIQKHEGRAPASVDPDAAFEAAIAANEGSQASPPPASVDPDSAFEAAVAANEGQNLVDRIPGLNWVNENIFMPISGKLGEVAGAALNFDSEQVRLTALQNMLDEGRITEEEFARARAGGKGAVDPGIGVKGRIASDLFLRNAFSSLDVGDGDSPSEKRPIGDMLAYAQTADTAGESLAKIAVVNAAKGAKFLWDDNNAGKLERWGSYLTMPGQMVARAATTALAEIGALPRKDALEILSQSQVNMSDLVDHYWIPSDALSKVARGTIGLTLDIILDPINYLGPISLAANAAIRGSGALKVGGRLITNPGMVAKVERQALMAVSDIDKIIKKGGEIVPASQADDISQLAREAIENRGFEGLDVDFLERVKQINPEAYPDISNALKARQEVKGFTRSLADGDITIGVGFRPPFSKSVVEYEIPLFSPATRFAAEAALGVKDWSLSSANRMAGIAAEAIEKVPVIGKPSVTAGKNIAEWGEGLGDIVTKGFQELKTFTTRPLWDSASNKFINGRYKNSQWALNQIAEASKEAGIDQEDMKLMVDWLETMPNFSDEELIRRFKPYDESNLGYVGRTGGDYLQDLPTGAPRTEPLPGAEIDWRNFREDTSKEAQDWALKQYEESGYLEAQARFTPGRGASPKNMSPGGPGSLPLINRGPIDVTEIPKSRKRELFGQSDFLTPITKGSPGKEFTRIGSAEDAGSFGTTFGYTPIRPTKDTLSELAIKKDLRIARQLADETMAKLELKNPAAARRARLMRDQMNERIFEMERRDIPFKPLNPFDTTVPAAERAMGYFPHILNPDYIEAKGGKISESFKIFENMMTEMGLKDKTQVGRAERRKLSTIEDQIKAFVNDEAPVFVNDPVTAVYQRIQDMDDLIAQHDLMKEVFSLARVKVQDPQYFVRLQNQNDTVSRKIKNAQVLTSNDLPRGYVEFNMEKYASPVFRSDKSGATIERYSTEQIKSKEFLSSMSFMPKEYIESAKNGTIYFPEDVATRIDYILQRPKTGTIRSILAPFDYLFRNSLLFGTGYHGMNAFSNLTTYATARGDLSEMAKATKFIWDVASGPEKVRNKVYTFGSGAQKFSMTGEELYYLAAQEGILANSLVKEADRIDDIWDNIATTYSTRQKNNIELKNKLEVLTMFKHNRMVAENTDNIFRMGLFFDSLEKGYTIKGARERVETYFYDFRDVPRGQRIVSMAMPFSSFALKTLESVVGRAKKLDFTPITIPHRVNQIMNGAYVDPYEDRRFIQAVLPDYAKDMIIGPALPGARQLRIEAPFVIPAIKAFMNPAESAHPLAGLLALSAVAAGEGNSPQDPQFEALSLDSPTLTTEFDKVASRLLQTIIPPTIKWPITAVQLQSPDEVRSLPLDFIKRYKQGTLPQALQRPKGEILLSKNANQFGKMMREISPDWLYNSLFFGSFTRDENLTDRDLYNRDVMFGNIVKSQTRNISLGTVRMDNVDRMILSYSTALTKHLKRIEQQKRKIIIESNVFIDPNTPYSDQLKSNLPENIKNLIAEQVEVTERRAALKSFYGFYLSERKSGGTFFDQAKNILAPQERMLTTREAAVQNVKRRQAETLIYNRTSERIRGDYQ